MYFVDDSGNKHEINRALPAAILSAAAPRKAAMKSPFRRRLAEPGKRVRNSPNSEIRDIDQKW
jgi:hypothetical protein